ncbi:MAG: hypothetical protein K5923_02070 [Clostridia bacterium]|nr:hypothetical protein [Clostridia bacterium]
MRNSSAKILIFSILFMAIFAIVASCLFVTISNGNAQTYYLSADVNTEEVASYSSSSYDVTVDGSVPNGTAQATYVAARVAEGYKKITTASDFNKLKGGSDTTNFPLNGNYVLGASFTIDLSASGTNTTFSGILDGAGYTITISDGERMLESSNKQDNRFYFGGIIDRLSGTIKNLNVRVLLFRWHDSRSGGDKCHLFTGLMVGSLQGGTVSNCKVTHNDTGTMSSGSYDPSNSSYYYMATVTRRYADYWGQDHYQGLGGIAGWVQSASTIEDTTMELNAPLTILHRQTKNTKCYSHMGGLVGETGAALTINRCTFSGNSSGLLFVSAETTGNSRGARGKMGGIVGNMGADITINGLIYTSSYDFKTVNQAESPYCGYLVGNKSSGNLTVNSMYLRSDASFDTTETAHWIVGSSQSFSITGLIQYSQKYPTGLFADGVATTVDCGFAYKSSTSYIWFTCPAVYSNGVGTFVWDIKYGSTANNVYRVTGPAKASSVAVLDLTTTSCNLTFEVGYYGSVTYANKNNYSKVYDSTSSISIGLTYTKSTSVSASTTTSINCAATPDATDAINVGTNKTLSINKTALETAQSWTSLSASTSADTTNKVFIDVDTTTSTYSITKASARTDASSNYSGTYDGSAHYITCSATGFLGSDTYANTATVYYSGTSAEDANTTNNTTNIGITHVSESVKTIYYRIEFDNYATITGSKTITITPAAIVFDTTTAAYDAVKSKVYSSYALYNSGITTSPTGYCGSEFYDALLKAAQSQPATKLEYYSMISSGSLTFTSYASDGTTAASTVQNAGTYVCAISAVSNGNSTADYTLQGTPTFTYYITKATPTISFTTIGDNLGSGVAIAATTGTTSEGKLFDFDSVTRPTATATIESGVSIAVSTDTTSWSTATVSNVGAYSVVYSIASSTNLNAASYTYNYTISKNTTTAISMAKTTESVNYRNSAYNKSTYGDSYVTITIEDSLGNLIYIVNAGTVNHGATLNSSVAYTGNQTGYTGGVTSSSTAFTEAGVYVVTYNLTGTSNYNGISDTTYTLTINKRALRILFDDKKELYDSILDTTGNYYDFIYVRGSGNFSSVNDFISNYSKYFTKLALYGTTPTSSTYTLSDYVTITSSVTSSSAVGNYYLSYAWGSSATDAMKNNYNITSSSVIVATTGSGYSEDTTNCAAAVNNSTTGFTSYRVRIRVVSSVSTTVSSISDLQTYMSRRYYDDSNYYTSITLSSNIDVDQTFTGTHIFPSYRTLIGGGYTIYYLMNDSESSSYHTYSPSGSSAYVDVDDMSSAGHTSYYGAGMLAAVNYGVIKNITFNFYRDEDTNQYIAGGGGQGSNLQINGFSNKNTSIGGLVGINAGIISSNTLYFNRPFKFAAQSASYSFAFGQFAGINIGSISSNTISTEARVKDQFSNASWVIGNNYYYTRVEVSGSAKEAYYGLMSGINHGTISGTTYNNNCPNVVSFTCTTLYAGGFVGYSTGSISTMTYNNNQATYNGQSSTHSGSHGVSASYSELEMYFASTGNAYTGGIIGWNAGTAQNCSFTVGTNAYLNGITTTANKMVTLGGVAGINEGTIQSISVVISGKVNSGSHVLTGLSVTADADVNAAIGGLVGVNSGLRSSGTNYGGTITGCSVIINSAGKINSTRGEGSGNIFSGGLLGVGCEIGTYDASHRVSFASINVEPGTLADSTMFNYGRESDSSEWSLSIGANHGFWGYLTGYYNSILSNNPASHACGDTCDYEHEYGGLIWYTQYDTPQSNNTPYPKTIFGRTATVLGYNGDLPDSTDVYITGIAGIGFADGADGTLSSAILNGVTIDAENSEVVISFNSFTSQASTGSYIGWDCIVNGTTTYITTQSQNRVTYATSYTEGTIRTSTSNANAIIRSTADPATIAEFVVRPYVNITSNDEYCRFVNCKKWDNNPSQANILYWCAGYGILTTDYSVDGVPWEETLGKNKTFDGNGHTISYSNTTDDNRYQISVTSQISTTSTTTINYYIAGNLIGINKGTIKDLTINLATSSKTIQEGQSAENYAYGIIAAINQGTISACTVNITGSSKVGILGGSSGLSYAFGPVAGISFGTISGCKVRFTGSATACIEGGSGQSYNSSRSAYLGGIVGISTGGTVEDCVVIGKGNIQAINSYDSSTGEEHNIGAYVGGIAGLALLNQANNTGSVYVGFTDILVGKTILKNLVVALDGDISSASTTSGGTGYITGKAFETSNNINTIINDYSSSTGFGTLFVLAGGNPTLVSRDPAKAQNTIFGASNTLASANAYTNLTALSTILLADYSVKGLGAFSFISTLSISYTKTGLSTFMRGSFSSSVVSITFTNSGTSSPTIGSTLTTSAPQGAAVISTVISNSLGTSTALNVTSTTNNPWIKYTMNYSVTIAAETLNWQSAQTLNSSPFVNFISGVGNEPLYAGAKEATLAGDITYDKHAHAAIVFAEGKVLHGANHTISSSWVGGEDNTIAGVTDSTTNRTYGASNVGTEGEYPYTYSFDGVDYYGISDLISINYGTIEDITVSLPSTHFYTGLNANSAYGSLVGINAGIITNCNVTISGAVTYSIGAANKQTIVGGAVGINVGIISDLTVTLSNTYKIINKVESTSSYGGNIVFATGVAVNGIDENGNPGSIEGIKVVNNGSMQVGTPLADGTTNSDLSGNAEVGRKIISLTLAGIVGINSGASLSFATISGSGSFIVNSKYYTNIDSENNTADLVNFFDIRYAYFAVGVALASNDDGTISSYNTGVNVYDSILNGANAIKAIIIDYVGNIQLYATNYMVGLAFAKAASSTHVTSSNYRYKGIIWNEEYNSDIDLYTVNSSLGLSANISAGSSSAGLALMGWVDIESDQSDFVAGTQITANVTDLELYWEKVGSTYTGNIVLRTSEYGMKAKNPISSIGVYYLPNGEERANIFNNSTYYTLSIGSDDSKTLLVYKAALVTNNIIVNDSTAYNGHALRIDVVFNYPYVEINDVYQLVQFLWFDSNDSDNIANYYLRTYITEIRKLITNNLKKATGSNPYGAWVNVTNADIDRILSHYEEQDYYIYYFDSTYYYIFIERYYDEDGDEIRYYSANEARLGANISLNQYGHATPDFGFDKTTSVTFPESKTLDGMGYTITLIANDYNRATYNSLPTTSKWYDSSNSNSTTELTFSDTQNTPSKGESCFVYGGFIGINRGHLQNIVFSFKSGSILNIAEDNGIGDIDLRRNVYAGLVCAYSTGVIDGCTLVMEDNTQFFINKHLPSLDGNFFDPKSDHDYYGGVFMGGFVGLLGYEGVISNSTVTFGANAYLGAHNVGNNGIGMGHIYTYVGGFTGMMTKDSKIYNAKIEGEATSRIFAIITSTNFTRVVTGAGGVVGVNTTTSTWNQWNIGEGTIDGVIYNWKGRTISPYWNGGLAIWGWEPNLGGDRETLTIYQLGGNVAGVIGNSSGNSWETNSITNLYYTFDIADYAVSAEDKEVTLDLRYYVVNNGVRTGATSPATMQLYNNSNKNSYVTSANASVSDARSGVASLNNSIKVISIYKMPYSNNTTSNTGVTITGGTTIEYNNGKSIVTTDYSSLQSSGYEKETTVGDLLSWNSKLPGADIKCHFVAGQENASAIMWQITITNAVSVTGSSLQNPESGHTAVTEIPVYKFAKSLEEAQTYRVMNYVIQRGQGNGMALYYCMGDAAVLSPNKNYYSNQVTEDSTVYYPMKAIMYDGETNGYSTSVSIYDATGGNITRVGSSNVLKILDNAGSSISRVTKVYEDGSYQVALQENERIKEVGSYQVQFTIKTNGLNNNAYVDSNYRVLFFNAQGNEAERTSEAGGVTKTYVKRGNYYYEKVTDAQLIAHLSEVVPSQEGVYTYNSVAYTKVNGEYYKSNYETDNERITELDAGVGKVETYTIYIVIAPVSIKLTSVTKLYDGFSSFNYTANSTKNYTSFVATLDMTYTYANKFDSSPTITSTQGKLELKDGSKAKVSIAPKGSYDSALVGERTATFDMAGSTTYTLYRYDTTKNAWYTMNITTYYLDDASSTTTYFTISELTTLLSVNDNSHTETYGWANPNTSFSITHSSAQSGCVVKIYKAAAPTITFDSAIVKEYVYNAQYVDYVTGSDLLSHILITTAQGNTWAATDSTYFGTNDFTIVQEVLDIKDVQTTAYTATITVTYHGTEFMTTSTQLSLSVYVLPAELTPTRVVKDYDGTTDIASASTVMQGFMGTDVIGSVTGHYASANVGKDINVTFTNSTSTTINSHTYELIFSNYYLSKKTWAVGIIAPIEAEIINAYKMFDGTTIVSYTGTSSVNATTLLIKSGNNVLNIKPNEASYDTNQVGVRSFTTTLEAFKYTAANGSSITRYIIKDGASTSNYYIKGANNANYTAANKASIIPAKVTVSSVYKEYDGTTDLGTFVMSGQINNAYPAFDGEYSSENVVYSSGAYNDVYLEAAPVVLQINDGSTTTSQTYYVLKYSGNNTNYELDTTASNTYKKNGENSYVIEGQGVIIPAAVTITNVTKYYDASATFNTSAIYALNDNNVGATMVYNGVSYDNFVFTGYMSGKDAGTEYDVSVETVNFVYNNVTYNWLYNSANSTNNNYRVDTTTFSKVGTILQITIKISNSSNTGNISAIYFSTAAGNKVVNSNHYVSGVTNIFEATYLYGQTYSTSNFCGTLTIGGTQYYITNGSCTVDGSSLSFTLDKSVTNAGIHQFTISMTSAKSNYTLDASRRTFYFGIAKKVVDAKDMQIVIANLTKTYDGTSIAPSVSKATAIRANVGAEGYITNWDSKTFGDVSLSLGTGCVGVGTYQQGSGSNRFIISEVINCESTNYKFSGTVGNVYNTTAYTNQTTYSITKANLTAVSTIVKDFDGIASIDVELDGVNGEKIAATYSYTPSAAGLGILPGVYTGSVEVSHDNPNYNTMSSQSITLTINKAKVVLERGYSRTTSGIAYFNLALAFTNIKGYDFLTFANPLFTSAMAADLEQNGVATQDETMLPAFVAALNSLLVFKSNDAVATTEITVSMLYAVNVYEDINGVKTLEVLIKGEETLDNETLTDKYSVYMMGVDLVENVNVITSSVIASNIAVSSSELADGQYNGAMVTTGVAISTVDDLLEFIDGNNATGYLTNNIYGYDASKLERTTAFAGTLYGNGYTIELVGGYNSVAAYYGAFVGQNSGTIQDVNFKFLSSEEIDEGTVGLVVGNNSGTISNCSLDIGVGLTIKDETTPSIGGLAGTSSGTLTSVTVVYSANVSYAAFGGIANTITAGTATYVTARNNASATSLAGRPIAISSTIIISNVIDAISFTNTLVGSGTLDNVYGQSATALAMYANSFTNGYLDYYFTTKTKFTTSGVLHNEYNTAGEENVNRTHYYGYDSTKADSYYYVAIEVIAPLNRFVWEAFDAYYTTYGTSLNRVVGVFALTQDLTDTGLTLNTNVNNVQATIFTPVIGRIVSTVISAGTDMIKEYEYTGSRITATFEAEIEGDPENTITLTIAGTDVGVYTEYYEEVAEGEESTDFAWDIEGFTAQIITSSASSVGEQSIMLIIVPKQLSDTPTLTKQYDSTNIAETHIDTNNDSITDIYAVGQFNNTAVGTGYEVKYNSTTKPVAAYLNDNVYTFVTYHLSGYDKDTNTKIYTVEFIYINSSAFTSATDVTALSKANFARAYYELVTLEELQALASAQNTQIIYRIGISGVNELTSVYVYDLTFARTTNINHEVTWGNSVSYSTSLYNVNGTLNRNYNYLLADNAFSGNSIFASASAASTTQKVVSQDGGSITQRTVNGAYTNLNQSYRKALQAIGISIASVADLDNIPYSLTEDQKTALISAINTELSSSISFSGDVLGATIADENNEDRTKITYNSTDNKYYAASQGYTTVQLTALSGTYSVTTNLAVVFTSGATLTLRYFEYDTTSERFIIDSFEALLMVDNAVDGEGEYQTLDYIITRNINAKAQTVETFGNTFSGTIDGNNKIIRNFTLVGTDSTSLFSTLAEGASIINVTFMNVLAIATTNADMSVVAATNNGTISGVKVEATFVSDGTIAIKPFATTNSGTIASSIAIVETSKAVASTTISAPANNETVVLYRTYGLAGSVAFYINGVASNYASVSNDAKSVMQTNRLNTPVTITNEVVQINNFREYWVYINIFGYLSGSNTTTFIGYQFAL